MFRYAVFALAALVLPASANADSGFSVGGNVLVGFAETDNVAQYPVQTGSLSDDTDNMGINGGAGAWLAYKLADLPFSFELGSNWRYRHDLNITYTSAGLRHDAKLNVMAIDTMLSALWHIPTGTRWTPYVGGGAGAVYLESENETISGTGNVSEGTTDDWNLGWQLQAGVNYSLSQSWDLRADYRYIDLGSVTSSVMTPTSSTFEADLASHDVRLGAMYKF